MRKLSIAALLGALVVANPAAAQQLQPLPTTREGNYAMAQRFANCSAWFGLMEVVATRTGMPETVTLAQGRARGWKVAGLLFMVEGMALSRAAEATATFDNLVEVRLMELKARYEQDAVAITKALPVEFARECEPLVPMQEKLIELIRRGPTEPQE
ncbi:MAG: hypothetical protein Q7S93_09925 [Phenylobacterium sp.]|uniref:hypothetical protein n=1 Tax=Phenylobacterium sp. TaxID=1871053 RepID=UPI00272701DB|nr:hypothetical protein [Phenylobacterium sp.]MDO8410364.1 hypothetical protein [Phenylobacterium sp.]